MACSIYIYIILSQSCFSEDTYIHTVGRVTYVG